MQALPRVLDLATLQRLYREGGVTPLQVVEEVLRRIAGSGDEAVWISRVPEAELRAAARQLTAAGAVGGRPPLWGVPFAVKDNIDCAGLDTTAACPAYRYTPTADAPVVARLRAAGALLVGKTNLDQFATGLNGTRSPYGAPRCVFDARYISGGSSSGSAVAVAAGQAAFALATDTAGSGRVPAAFNNLVGVKPTRGLLSVRGMVPACRSLDCVSVLAATVADADRVRRVAQGGDPQDPYSRGGAQRPLPQAGFRFGMLGPRDREFFGDTAAARLYEEAGARLRALGGLAVEFDFAPFRQAAELLYSGPWVAERLEPLRGFMREHADAMDPSVRAIMEGAGRFDGADVFAGWHRLQELRAAAAAVWSELDLLLLPTAPTQYTVEQMLQEPLRLNSRLGIYTNFVNLLDCCAVAVPAGFRGDGLPFGVSLIAPAFTDDALAALAARLHHAAACGLGIDRAAPVPAAEIAVEEGTVLAVVGAHLSGMPLNHELSGCGGRLLRQCRTAPDYRLYVLPDTVPPKPGLVRDPGYQGPGIELELWALPAEAFGVFVARIPTPLGIGKLRLEDGGQVSGFLCESHAVAGAQEITHLGGWRSYLAQRAPSRS